LVVKLHKQDIARFIGKFILLVKAQKVKRQLFPERLTHEVKATVPEPNNIFAGGKRWTSHAIARLVSYRCKDKLKFLGLTTIGITIFLAFL